MLNLFLLLCAAVGFGAMAGALAGVIVSVVQKLKKKAPTQEPWWDEPTESGYSFKELDALQEERERDAAGRLDRLK